MKILVFLTLFSINCFPHGDHSIPGAIPPAPHGGILGEAKHDHGISHMHDHKKASEREIFFEGIYKNKSLTVHFLELDPKTTKFFFIHDFTDLKDLKISIQDARKKKKISKDHKLLDKKVIIDMNGQRARRLFVKISGKYKGAKYSSEFQVERK